MAPYSLNKTLATDTLGSLYRVIHFDNVGPAYCVFISGKTHIDFGALLKYSSRHGLLCL